MRLFFDLKKVICCLIFAWGVSSPVLADTILVSAATSLRDVFMEISAQFEKDYAGAKIEFVFGASAALLHQVAHGAPVDVLAVADYALLDEAKQKKVSNLSNLRVFAHNRMVLIESVSAAGSIKSMDDLQNKDINRIALGNPKFVPAGRYASDFLKHTKLWGNLEPKLVFTQDVRQTLEYVARGEVDVGFVYQTDAQLIKDRVKILFAVPVKDDIRYGVATVSKNKMSDYAVKFVDFICSSKGQEMFKKYGFMPAINFY